MTDPQSRPLAKLYTSRHLLATAIATPLILRAIGELFALLTSSETRTIDALSQFLAIAVVTAFYASPLKATGTAPLDGLKAIDRRLMAFALVGFIAFLVAPIFFPKGSLEDDVATVDALTVMGIGTILIIPISLAMKTLLIGFSRHFAPIYEQEQS